MNLCTISTYDWLDKHLVRWVRYAKKNIPGVRLFLFYADQEARMDHPVLKNFSKVAVYKNFDGRKWFNEIRMKACGTFGVDDMLYCDADADILQDVTGIQRESDKPLLCVKSPATHDDWDAICAQNKWKLDEVNNGLLYMRKDFDKEYAEAEKEVAKYVASDRIRGTIVFNLLCKMHPELVHVAPYSYSTIWWDIRALPEAKIVQYCSDRGQEKRIFLEKIYRAAYQ